MVFLQSRWNIEGNNLYYYGLRVKPNLFKNKIRISQKQVRILRKLPKELSPKEYFTLKKLLKKGIVVEEERYHPVPKSLDEAKFCRNCIANDFMIPGLELNRNGLCPMCETQDETSHFKSVVPLKNVIPKSKYTKYDVALFYTGGKDSSYLLYYLVKVLKLRVLALTWDIPYMSESAKQSIKNAKKLLSNTTFISRKLDDYDQVKMYKKLYELEGNNCACPSMAYVLFYELLVKEKVPYFVLGNEPVQMLNLYYNHLAPKIAFNPFIHQLLNFFVNIGRVLTLRKPFRNGQFHALATMKQLAYGDSLFKRLSGYNNSLVTHVSESIRELDYLLGPFRKAIKESNKLGTVPAFVHIDFDDTMQGNYRWSDIKDLIIKEVGWVAPPNIDKSLHTSCNIEICKENSQFRSFYQMKSKIIPFSAIELSLASKNNNVSKEEALNEVKKHMGFSLEEVKACNLMKDYMKKTNV